ncbi:hypothetical protein AC1031_003702 [Aphanomyces cochlioides]|nr:hypothetical protein AC1031_003702 [Aphanomyces cochlioides]
MKAAVLSAFLVGAAYAQAVLGTNAVALDTRVPRLVSRATRGSPTVVPSGAPTTAKPPSNAPTTSTPSSGGSVCDIPKAPKWSSTGALASPKSGWVSLKDFTTVVYNGKHIVYGTVYTGTQWNSFAMSPFSSWSDMASATQYSMPFGAPAPTLFYFRPKSI